ncbi:phage holin family protein [Paenibacillus sp. IITD108]|uniref:phage holin family protein n=1 Tax=Paenibacillus sp. IITD108 TaxID=3116649 RepID=UPI002F41EBC4
MFKQLGQTILTAAIGSTGKETAIGGVIAAIGTGIVGFLGGWDKGLQLLLWLMIADYVSGLLKALKTKSVDSEVMFWGGVRKIIVLVVVGLAALVDQWLGDLSGLCRTAAIFFYIAREGLSVTENLGVLGVPMPDAIKDRLSQVSNGKKGDSHDRT